MGKYKHVFKKGCTPNYTTGIFKSRKVNNTYHKTYLLKDFDGDPIQGGFYKEKHFVHYFIYFI